jgi:hypothetical protein
MNERHSRYITTLLVGGAGMLFLVGVGATYSVALTNTGVAATMATVLVTIGLVGLLVLAGVVAARWSITGRGSEVPVGEPDAELLRILDDVRFGALKRGREHR